MQQTATRDGARRGKKPAREYVRITEPMVRENGVLVPTTWEHALDVAADGFKRNLAARGPNSTGIFSCSKSTNEVNFAAAKFARVAFGSHHIDSCNRT